MDRRILIGSALLVVVAAIEFGLLGAGAAGLTGGPLAPAHERGERTATPAATQTPGFATCVGFPDTRPCRVTATPVTPCDNNISPPPVSPPCATPPSPPPCDAGVSPPPVSPPPVSPPCGPSAAAHVIQLSTTPEEIVCNGIKGAQVNVRALVDASTSVADGTPVFFQVLGGPGSLDPYVAYTLNGNAGTFVRFGPSPYPIGAFHVQVDVGRIEATIRIFCTPQAPPPLPPCSPSPPASSPPCAPPTPRPTPLPCTPGAVSPPPCPVSPPPAPSIGGRISIGTPALSGGDIVVPVLTSASQDPYSGFNATVAFDTSLLTYTTGTSGGALETSGAPTFCAPPMTFSGRANIGCVILGQASTTSAGTLANLTFARKAAAGCVTLHVFTYGPPDGGDTTTGTFTISPPSAPNWDVPQQNTYGPDVSVNLADGSTGCAGPAATATPTPTATGTPRAWTATPTMTPSPTPTAVPTDASTPAAAATATADASEGRRGRPRGAG
ncbi:MAG: hypothetical protein KGK07_12660 [Chloroflexota bacterium]|nr:hypothetical protein [Chloroflexota bacterium]